MVCKHNSSNSIRQCSEFCGDIWAVLMTLTATLQLNGSYRLFRLAVYETWTGTGTKTWTNGLYSFMYYIEPFTLHLNRDRGQHLSSPIVLVLVPVPVSVPYTASVITPLHLSCGQSLYKHGNELLYERIISLPLRLFVPEGFGKLKERKQLNWSPLPLGSRNHSGISIVLGEIFSGVLFCAPCTTFENIQDTWKIYKLTNYSKHFCGFNTLQLM